MKFQPLEPLDVPRQPNGLVVSDRKALRAWWESVDEAAGLNASQAIGCYIFSIRYGTGVRPWYVGMAEFQSFARECFTDHKLKHYNNVTASRRGQPTLTLVPCLTPSDAIAKPRKNGRPAIQLLERMLIGNCLARNPELINVRDTRLMRKMVVPGLMNGPRGKTSDTVAKFKKLIGV